VITQTGSTREYFSDHAHYVDHRSPDDIRHAIDAALARGPDPQLRAHVSASYTWASVTAALPRVYDAAIARHRTSRR
jgi:hypothetical protein